MTAARSSRIRLRATLVEALVEETYVERSGPGKAPTAFRVWKAGDNKADDGVVRFTPESAVLLIAEQVSRDRPYSIDFDHLSLATNRPAEAGRAAGWHRLQVRPSPDGPELWAVDVEWVSDVREGLEESPPRWRYFSPAFTTDQDDQITSYVNLALCINPMTHGIPLLASRTARKDNQMTAKEKLSLLDAQIEATDDANLKEALTAARKALAAAEAGEPDAAEEAATKAPEDEEKKAASGDEEDEKKKAAAAPPAPETHAHAASTAGSDAVTTLTAKVLDLERKLELGEIESLLAKHPGLPEEFRTHCRTRSLPDAKAMLSVVGKKFTTERKAAASQPPTNASDAIDPQIGEAMDRAMGITSVTAIMPRKLPDGRFVMHNVRPSDLLRHQAQKGQG